MARLNVYDWALSRGSEGEVEIARGLIKAKPELALFPIRAVDGYLYQPKVGSARPTAASRSFNEEKAAIKATSVSANYKLAQYQERSETDASIIKGLTPEEAAEERNFQDMEALEAITDDFMDVVYNGDVASNPKDFDGYRQYASSLNGNTGYVSNNSPICLSAGGSGSDLTSVYAYKFSNGGKKGVELLYNRNHGALPTMEDLGLTLAPSSSSSTFAAYVTVLDWAAGMTYPSNATGRIANIEDAASNTITAELINKLDSYMNGIDLLVMNRNTMVRINNVAIGAIDYTSSDGTLATKIKTAYGIPFVVSDSITQTETAVS
jgi:hypothetical protein